MQEELYGVVLDGSKEYAGRDLHGRIKYTVPDAGLFMDRDTAEKLTERLKAAGFKSARVVTMLRGERDEIAATSLAELGEDHLGTLTRAIKLALENGVSKQEVLDVALSL